MEWYAFVFFLSFHHTVALHHMRWWGAVNNEEWMAQIAQSVALGEGEGLGRREGEGGGPSSPIPLLLPSSPVPQPSDSRHAQDSVRVSGTFLQLRNAPEKYIFQSLARRNFKALLPGEGTRFQYEHFKIGIVDAPWKFRWISFCSVFFFQEVLQRHVVFLLLLFSTERCFEWLEHGPRCFILFNPVPSKTGLLLDESELPQTGLRRANSLPTSRDYDSWRCVKSLPLSVSNDLYIDLCFSFAQVIWPTLAWYVCWPQTGTQYCSRSVTFSSWTARGLPHPGQVSTENCRIRWQCMMMHDSFATGKSQYFAHSSSE